MDLTNLDYLKHFDRLAISFIWRQCYLWHSTRLTAAIWNGLRAPLRFQENRTKDPATLTSGEQCINQMLPLESSGFSFSAKECLLDGSDSWMAVYKFEKQSALPGSCLLEDRIVPFILREIPKSNAPVSLFMIPQEWYR